MDKINDKYIDELPDEYKQSYLDHKKGLFHTEEWGSHQPLLIHVVNTITKGDIIELGMGDNSTPLLHLLCEKQGRNLFSYEFDAEWYNKYKKYQNSFHSLFLLDENRFKRDEYPLHKKEYAIAFIDSHPAWTRHHAMKLLKDSVDYFIIHDTSYLKDGVRISDNNYDFSGFKNVMHFEKVNRASTLFTNKEIIEELQEIFK